ncbi:Pol polyprotein [Smittium culicis]|uniref:Pol polyprotein n=1 Tax=Smittium culicis TaxID=133412 RepID=A0A1R1YDF7_9FUNG|nr:Pol polyprotein [Smittium culicis]
MSAKTLEPKVFVGKEGDDPNRWIKRYECFRKTNKWSDDEAVDYLDLFLEGRALNWYKGYIISNKDWPKLKEKFCETFVDQDEETTAWNQLIGFSSEGKDIIEINGVLAQLYAKAKIVTDAEKIKYLMKSLSPEKKRKLLENSIETFEDALEVLAKEKYEKIINSKNDPMVEVKNSIKEVDVMKKLIDRFDGLSLNLLNREKELASLIKSTQEKLQNKSYSNYKCFNCDKYGHSAEYCKNPPRSRQFKDSNYLKNNSEKEVNKDLNCLELDLYENEVFIAEKRNINDTSAKPNKRNRIVDPEPTRIEMAEYADKPIIQSRKPATIKLSQNTIPYSIGKDLANSKADLSYSQLLQVAPSVRNELIGLCKKQDTKELSNVETEESNNTNCRGIVKIFDDRHWAVLDTGAACSVMSTALMKEIGLEVDSESYQTVITADGTRHSTLGVVSQVPIEIANYDFPCDVLIMDLKKPILILGTEWFSKYNAILDLKSKELILEKPDVDVVLKLYTNKPKRIVRDEYEVFGIGVSKETSNKVSIPNVFSDLIKEYSSLFASDLSELTQTENAPYNERETESPVLAHPQWEKKFIVTTDASAVENIQTSTVVDFIITEIVQVYGVPQQLITDRGSNFLSETSEKLYEFLEIKHKPTTTYRPQANGQVERLNQTLKNVLSKLCREHTKDWDCYMWKTLLAIRSMKNRSTGYSPSEMLYGTEMTLPTSWEPLDEHFELEDEIKERESFIHIDLPEIRRIGLRKNVVSKNNSEARYNKKVSVHKFKTRDIVLKFTDVKKSKFSPVWEGPYMIVEVGDYGSYTIKDDNENYDTVHGDKLKLYYEKNRMIPEVSSAKLQSTLRQFRQVFFNESQRI